MEVDTVELQIERENRIVLVVAEAAGLVFWHVDLDEFEDIFGRDELTGAKLGIGAWVEWKSVEPDQGGGILGAFAGRAVAFGALGDEVRRAFGDLGCVSLVRLVPRVRVLRGRGVGAAARDDLSKAHTARPRRKMCALSRLVIPSAGHDCHGETLCG